MRIIFIDPIGQMLGFYDYRICLQLAQRGHQVTLVTTESSYSHRQGEVSYRIYALFGRTDQTEGKLKKGLAYFFSMWRLLRLAGRDGLQLLCFQYHLFPPVDLLFILLSRARGQKVVIFAHDVLPLNHRPHHKCSYSIFYRAANKVVVFARVNKDKMVDLLGIDPQKVFVSSLGNFLNPAPSRWTRRRAGESVGVPEMAKVVLFFGQIKETKGIDHLIRAFPDVVGKEPEAMLVIAGKPLGVGRSFLSELIREQSLEHRVIVDARYIPDEEVPKYFECADVAVLPYTEVYQSAVLMLACSYGTPVVASAVGGIPEVITDGVTGYLVPPGDEEELAAAIVRSLQNPAESRRMGRRAQLLMEQEFSWERSTRELEEFLAQV